MRFLYRKDELNLDGWRSVVQSRLRDHWREGRSAALLAHRWFEAAGPPPLVADALSVLFGSDFVLDEGLVERETQPPGMGSTSATDLLALGSALDRKVVLAVEGKVDEGFDHRVQCWADLGMSSRSRRNRTLRWTSMAKDLKLDASDIRSVPYQLLQLAWAAFEEGRKRGALHAVLVVHSFDDCCSGWDEFVSFARCFRPELTAVPGVPACVSTGDPLLWLVWVADTGGVAEPQQRCSACGAVAAPPRKVVKP